MVMKQPTAPSSKPRVKAWVETYGCQMNVSDGELMQGILAGRGYAMAAGPADADVILVNTCAIRDHAEQRVIGRVGELYRLKRDRPELVIGVTGCMAQRLGETLLERAPYVDVVMGPDGYRSLPDVLARLRPEFEDALGPAVVPAGLGAAPAHAGPGDVPQVGAATPRRRALPVLGNTAQVMADAAAAESAVEAAPGQLAVLELNAGENYEGLEVRRSAGVSAWVPVQRGCNYRCTYCIVPYVRGDEKNRSPEHILEEVRGIVAQGITEVVLLGQTVNSYEHGGWDFPRLLRAVARVPGVRRVRFTSPHPNDFTAELVDVMATEPNVCRQLHLPVQSGHDRTLKRMLRRYTVAAYLEKIEMVRRAIPDIALSTDIIVAFPGETDEEYEATLALMRQVRFDDAYLYRYSPRDGTPATRLPADQFLPDAVAQARLERLITLHRSIQAEINRGEVGSIVEVLVERPAKSAGDMLGRTESNKVVAFPGDVALIGSYLDVRITSTTGATFRGERARGGAAAGPRTRSQPAGQVA
jgi:tRNA-2-methylthio-N6-dimethylallyladenosine synthase